MNPVSLLAEISKKIVTTFTEIESMCRNHEQASSVLERSPKHQKSYKEDKPQKSTIKHEGSKKKQNDTPSKPKASKKARTSSPEPKDSDSENEEKNSSESQEVEKKGNDNQKPKSYPDAPKKPIGSYLLFLQQRKPKISLIFPDLSLTEISQVVGQEWRALSSSEKDAYSKKYEQSKIKYKELLGDYKKSHPDYDQNQKKKKKKIKAKAAKNNAKKSKLSISEESDEESRKHSPAENNQDQDSFEDV